MVRILSNVTNGWNCPPTPFNPPRLVSVPIVWYSCIMSNWKDIAGYEGLYQVSDCGGVRSLDRVAYDGKRLKGRTLALARGDKYGYLSVCLCNHGKQRKLYVHRLVAAAFIGHCPDGQEVRHGPNGPLDNSVGNLLYGTRSENHLDKRRDGTSGRRVKRSDGVEFPSLQSAADSSGHSISHVCNVCKGRRVSAGEFSWEYA